PSLHDGLQGPGVDVMELASALPPRGQQSGRFEDVEVLRDRLPRQPEPVLHRQPTAQLEQRLAIPLLQFVEDRPPGRCGEGLKDVAHAGMIRKSWLAYQPQDLGIVFAARTSHWAMSLAAPCGSEVSYRGCRSRIRSGTSHVDRAA